MGTIPSLSGPAFSRSIAKCPTPFPLGRDGAPAWLSLPEQIDQEALAYRAWGTPLGDLLSRAIRTLAEDVRQTGATTPEEFLAREELLASWESDRREREMMRRAAEAVACGESLFDQYA